MEFMRRALVAYDRGYDRGVKPLQKNPGKPARIRHKDSRNFEESPRHAAQ